MSSPSAGEPARVLQGRGEIGEHLQGHRRCALLDPRGFRQVDEDGTIHLLGRGSVCINSGGEKIFPEEVEELSRPTKPFATRSSSASRRDVRGTDRGRYRVGRRGDDGVRRRPTEAELIAHVKERLAGYKAPRRVRIVETIGRSPNGKVDYMRHRAESMEELEPAT